MHNEVHTVKQRKYTGLVLPEHQQTGKKNTVRAIGYILRGAVALLCSFGMSRFVFDCIGADLTSTFIFGTCLALTVLFGAMAINRALFASGAVLTLCGIIFALQSVTNIFAALRLVGLSVFNTWCTRLADIGYTSMSKEIIDISDELSDIGKTESQIFILAAFLMMLFFTAVCVFSVIRRARAVLILGAYAALVTVALYFEIIDTHIGFALMPACACAVVTLSLYDSVFCRKKPVCAALGTIHDSPDSRRELEYTLRANASLGGYAGALSALAALVIISLTVGVREPMKDIPKISRPAEKIQNYFISVLEGSSDSSLLSADSSVQESRKTTANERTSSGSRILEVQTDVDIPVYLRSWTGKDYYNDGWHTASPERLEEYRTTVGSGFSHEFLTSELICAVDPTLLDIKDVKTQDSLELGFVSSYVHISKKSPSGSLIYMPSYTDQRERLMRFGTTDKLHFGGYQNYYDGIFVSSGYIFADDYTVLARLGLLPTEQSVQNIAKLVRHYAGEYELLRAMRERLSAGENISDVRAAYPELAVDIQPISTVSGKYTFPTGENSLSYRYAYLMDEDERQHTDALTDNLSLYNSYVYDSYLTVYEHFDEFNALIKQICQENEIDMRRDAATYDGRHRIVSAVIDYLSKNMTYTLSPKAPSRKYTYSNGAATFLFDTKEGYCSQYASAAIILLRSAGIPARYAEGYIADQFSATTKKTATGKYISYVNDSNAHAWVEVYYDYYGWLTYEATTPYILEAEPSDSDIGTDTDSQTAGPDDTTASTLPSLVTTAPSSTGGVTGTSDVTTDSNTHKAPQNEHNSGGRKTVIAVVIVSAAICALVIILASLKRRADRERQATGELVCRARDGIFDTKERIYAARALGEIIMKLLNTKRLSPRKAETASAFGKRIDSMLGEGCDISFSAVMSAIGAAEFGGDVTPEELTLLADGVETLQKIILSEAGCFKRVVYKYFGLIS